MCETGDIILVKNYCSHGKQLTQHSFVVISNDEGEIQGINYDFICNVMSSFKDKKHRESKLRYPGNFPITHNDSEVKDGNDKDGYIKAEQFYYFDKNKTDYMVIGTMEKDILELLFDFIENLNVEIEQMIENL